jgi:hypothetical protein
MDCEDLHPNPYCYSDSLFQQNTLESIPLAIQLYVLASHIYGSTYLGLPE